MPAEYVAPVTEREVLLARIWAEVLGVPRVGTNDDFFDLGGDSVAAVEVVSAAEKRGLHLNLRDLFERQTIDGVIAGTAASRIPRPEVWLDLTPEQLRLLGDAGEPTGRVVSAAWYQIAPDVSADGLERTLAGLAHRHDALRTRVTTRNGRWVQRISDGPVPVALSRVSVEAVTPEVAQSILRQATQSVTAGSGPALAAVWVHRGAAPALLCLAASDLLADAGSWRLLEADLDRGWRSMEQDSTAGVRASFGAWLGWLAARGEDTAAAELAHWLSQSADGADLPHDREAGYGGPGRSDILRVGLPESEASDLWTRAARAWGVRPIEILLAALTQAMADWSGHAVAAVEVAEDARPVPTPDLDLSETVGQFTSTYPVRIDIEADTPLAARLLAVKEHLRAVPDRGLGYGLLRHRHPDGGVGESLARMSRPRLRLSVSDTAESTSSRAMSIMRSAANEELPSGAAVARGWHVIDIRADVVGGRLRLDWRFSTERYRRATVESLARRHLEHTRSLLAYAVRADPGAFTPSDFPMFHLARHGRVRPELL